MKRSINIIAVFLILLIPVLLTAQPQPWDPTVGGGEGTNPVGGGAPLGEGIILLLSLGIAYGARKYRQLSNRA